MRRVSRASHDVASGVSLGSPPERRLPSSPGRGRSGRAPAGIAPAVKLSVTARSASGPDAGIACTFSVSPAVSEVENASVSNTATPREGLITISCHPKRPA